jgi:cephalosporin-C deacetylase
MMKKYPLALCCAAAVCFGMQAHDLKVDAAIDHDLWWNAPEEPCIKLNVIDTLGNANESKLTFRITTDRDESKNIFKLTQNVKVAKGESGELQLQLPLPEPGFYKCVVEDDGNVINRFNIGYEPTNIVSLPDNNPDFDEFWEKALAELAAVDPQYKIKELPEKSGKKRKIYMVEMRSWGDEILKGYLAVPVAKGKYPVEIYYNGYSSKPWCMGADDRPDWIEFVVSCRGQFLCEDGNKYGDWIRYNLDKPAEYYYKGAFLDCIRAIDFVDQYEKTDRRNIFAEGGSQGGAFTLIAASLDTRLRAAAPYIPFLSDYRDYFKIVNWPAAPVKEEARKLGLSDEQMYNNLTYFDMKNFARRITCPILMGIGLQDPVCPPHTNMSSYNLITSPKQLKIYPLNGHFVSYDDWNPRRSEFFESYMVK